VPQGTLAERMRAAGAGIPAFYTPAAVGTELAEGRETRVFHGREYLLEEALPLDYAFIRAWQADAFGNLRFRRSQRAFDFADDVLRAAKDNAIKFGFRALEQGGIRIAQRSHAHGRRGGAM